MSSQLWTFFASLPVVAILFLLPVLVVIIVTNYAGKQKVGGVQTAEGQVSWQPRYGELLSSALAGISWWLKHCR